MDGCFLVLTWMLPMVWKAVKVRKKAKPTRKTLTFLVVPSFILID